MRILGIDPGYAIMGYGILDYKGNKFTPVEYGSITTEAHTPNEERLLTLYTELTRIIEEYRPDEAAIEELFYNTNATTAIMVGEARGMALLACAQSVHVQRRGFHLHRKHAHLAPLQRSGQTALAVENVGGIQVAHLVVESAFLALLLSLLKQPEVRYRSKVSADTEVGKVAAVRAGAHAQSYVE